MKGLRFVQIFFVIALVHSAIAMSLNWNAGLLDQHGFRQTQTAISTLFLLKGGPLLKYETPVLGPPWSIPFEFPLYQWIVALFAKILHSPLDQTGRAVSVLFYYLTLLPIGSALRDLGYEKRTRLIAWGLFLSSPVYLFWSRTFMIESLALFLSMSFLALFIRAWKKRSYPLLAASCVAGTLGALVKITTLFGFGFLVALYLLIVGIRELRGSQERFKVLGRIGAFAIIGGAIPLLALKIWNDFAAYQLSLNPLTDFINPSMLKLWVFGTWAERLSPDFWSIFIHRTTQDAIGFWWLVIAFVPLLFLTPLRSALLAAFLGVFYVFISLVFSNLHRRHNYYPYANSVFLVLAVALITDQIGLRSKKWAQTSVALFFVLILIGNINFYRGYGKPQRRNHPRGSPVADWVKAHVPENDVLFIYGADWSAEFAYYAERRAIMDRDYRPVSSPEIQRSLSLLPQDEKVGAVLFCLGYVKSPDQIERARALGMDTRPAFVHPDCTVYVKAPGQA